MTNDDKKPRRSDVHELIESAWDNGTVRVNSTLHSQYKSGKRQINDMDLREVILYGNREESEDRWRDERNHWTYALRNKDVDGRDIRAIFDVEAYPDVVVVTVMHVYP